MEKGGGWEEEGGGRWLGIGKEWGGRGLVGGCGVDKLVKRVGEGGNSIDGVVLVCFEPDLAAERPYTLHPGVVGEGAEQGVVGGCQIFVDGVDRSDTVWRGVRSCGVGSSDFDIFLEIQYASCVFGLALKS